RLALDTRPHLESDITRRDVLLGSAAGIMAATVPWSAVAQSDGAGAGSSNHIGDTKMNTITTKDGVTIFFKDWGKGQPIVFSHGWPLSSDDWDAQMMFFLSHGYRVVAHDRRGHGRSTQTADGHDMDHYADDLAALTAHLDLKNAIQVGHSTGGGEVARYLGRYGESRVAKAALISAVPPLMVKTAAKSGRPSQRSVRRIAGPARGQSLAILSRSAGGAFLWFQPAGRENLGGDHPELVEAGHDGRREGALRWHRRLLADRFHRRPQEDHSAGAGDARRRRSDCSLRRRRTHCRPSC